MPVDQHVGPIAWPLQRRRSGPVPAYPCDRDRRIMDAGRASPIVPPSPKTPCPPTVTPHAPKEKVPGGGGDALARCRRHWSVDQSLGYRLAAAGSALYPASLSLTAATFSSAA